MGTEFVIDNSIVMTWCFQDEFNKYANTVLEQLNKNQAFVPSIWPLEITNVLLVAERRKRLNKAESIRFIELISNLPIAIEQEPPTRIFQEVISLAREYHISTYDASYLDLAMRKGIPLATLDKGLKQAAKKSKVELY